MKVLNLTSGEYSDFGNVALLYWDGAGDGGLGVIEETFRDFRDTWKGLDYDERKERWPDSWNAIEAFMTYKLLPMGWKKLEHETLHED